MITSRIMLEAKRMLYHTASDISQIAFDLGYEDPSYFTRAFKRVEGKTPTEFREDIYNRDEALLQALGKRIPQPMQTLTTNQIPGLSNRTIEPLSTE